ncbi:MULTISPECIES: hypothetical protein [Mesonia]|uniref:Uncharacterized protein n=1 Tax=Mesonia oceanica TaxID=2687242 RepID=A0AC61Y6A8_9FLAO|nr:MULTISPECIES: hypothetical protein [Mesonia]MAN26122.1 hypothetical protein [Mesonia sp.]MAQ42255.1 hypothetical protein [Mesonia sp.]MBJ97877.1 hypothetical protein [Flavobacteriaceae bacterium]VVV00044.1 hypothetical protein FVB9532_01308 [Mesonia oceanica]|tara:strand:+ start:13651 stop:16455 length:2805 start_codon:yes stop_codon:yes gene_type:complete
MKNFITFIMLIYSVSIWSQKSAPIAGDAAKLIDLLHKDYQTVNLETFQEDIARDRSQVIAIFKTYLGEDFDTEITYEYKKEGKDTEKGKDTMLKLNDFRLIYTKSLETYNLKIKRDDLKETEVKNLKELKTQLSTDKNYYYKALYAGDNKVFDEIKKHLNKNKFLDTIIDKFKKKYETLNDNKFDSYAINNNAQSIQKSLPFAGGDILVDGIDGLSRFLVKRIKEELTLNAIQNIQEFLKNKEEHPELYELEVLLPTTFAYLANFDANQLLQFSDDLKQYIEQDLANLVPNAANLRYTPRMSLLIANNPELDFAFEGLEILDQVTKIKSPVDYFEIVSNSRNLNRWRTETGTKKDIAEGLHLASMLAYSLTIVENGEVRFVTTDFMANYGSQKDFCYLYFGFLYQQNKNYYHIKDKQGAKDNLLATLVYDVKRIDTIHNFLNHQVIPVVKHAERLHDQFLEIKKKNKNEEKLAYAEVHQLIEDIVGFAEEVSIAADWILEEAGADTLTSRNLEPYFKTAYLANDISLDLYEKRYTNAITKTLEVPLMMSGSNNSELAIYSTRLQSILKVNNDLISLTKVLSLNKVINDKEKEAIWNENKNQLEILHLKFKTNDELNTIATNLDNLIKGFKDGNWDWNSYNTNRKNLIDAISDDKGKLLNYFGIDSKAFKEKYQKLKSYKSLDSLTKVYIDNKFDAYQDELFNQLVLGEEPKIEAERELWETYNAFLPGLLESDNVKSKPQLVKLIHFVNDVAVADGPEAYEKAIEAFVLPVGSSRLKENVKSYYSINAFPGILGGKEISDDFEDAEFVGFTAPVGFYIQPWGSGEFLGCFNTFGIYFPVIDIAAPVRFRFDDSNATETLSDFEFKDIFSPGAYVVFGFKNSPFAFNLGFQYGPKLRDIPTDDNSSDFTSVESYRVGVGITIDIPLVTLSSNYKN